MPLWMIYFWPDQREELIVKMCVNWPRHTFDSQRKLFQQERDSLGGSYKEEIIRLSFMGEQMESQLTPPYN